MCRAHFFNVLSYIHIAMQSVSSTWNTRKILSCSSEVSKSD